MARRVFSLSWRSPIVAALIAVEALVLLTFSTGFAPPAQAQFFDGGGFFPFMQNPWGRSRRSYRPSQGRTQDGDFSKAPAPKKVDTPPQATVLVFGDSLADWLAYGLEL